MKTDVDEISALHTLADRGRNAQVVCAQSSPPDAQAVNRKRTFVHVHLVSDSTGETLITASRAAVARYEDVEAIEHVYPLVRSDRQVDRILSEIEDAPGIVMFTIVDNEVLARLTQKCSEMGVPCIDVLDPLINVFANYLNVQKATRIGAQHSLDAGYFRRIEALTFAMRHDDGALPDDIDEADVVLVGVSRTSKTPTSIYLANRGVRATNLPIVTGLPVPDNLYTAKRALIVGLTASPDRIVALRENRLLAMKEEKKGSSYVNRQEVAKEVSFARKLCAENDWPLIDVTRRSIEETAAAIVALLTDRRYGNQLTEPL